MPRDPGTGGLEGLVSPSAWEAPLPREAAHRAEDIVRDALERLGEIRSCIGGVVPTTSGIQRLASFTSCVLDGLKEHARLALCIAQPEGWARQQAERREGDARRPLDIADRAVLASFAHPPGGPRAFLRVPVSLYIVALVAGDESFVAAPPSRGSRREGRTASSPGGVGGAAEGGEGGESGESGVGEAAGQSPAVTRASAVLRGALVLLEQCMGNGGLARSGAEATEIALGRVADALAGLFALIDLEIPTLEYQRPSGAAPFLHCLTTPFLAIMRASVAALLDRTALPSRFFAASGPALEATQALLDVAIDQHLTWDPTRPRHRQFGRHWLLAATCPLVSPDTLDVLPVSRCIRSVGEACPERLADAAPLAFGGELDGSRYADFAVTVRALVGALDPSGAFLAQWCWRRFVDRFAPEDKALPHSWLNWAHVPGLAGVGPHGGLALATLLCDATALLESGDDGHDWETRDRAVDIIAALHDASRHVSQMPGGSAAGASDVRLNHLPVRPPPSFGGPLAGTPASHASHDRSAAVVVDWSHWFADEEALVPQYLQQGYGGGAALHRAGREVLRVLLEVTRTFLGPPWSASTFPMGFYTPPGDTLARDLVRLLVIGVFYPTHTLLSPMLCRMTAALFRRWRSEGQDSSPGSPDTHRRRRLFLDILLTLAVATGIESVVLSVLRWAPPHRPHDLSFADYLVEVDATQGVLRHIRGRESEYRNWPAIREEIDAGGLFLLPGMVARSGEFDPTYLSSLLATTRRRYPLLGASIPSTTMSISDRNSPWGVFYAMAAGDCLRYPGHSAPPSSLRAAVQAGAGRQLGLGVAFVADDAEDSSLLSGADEEDEENGLTCCFCHESKAVLFCLRHDHGTDRGPGAANRTPPTALPDLSASAAMHRVCINCFQRTSLRDRQCPVCSATPAAWGLPVFLCPPPRSLYAPRPLRATPSPSPSLEEDRHPASRDVLTQLTDAIVRLGTGRADPDTPAADRVLIRVNDPPQPASRKRRRLPRSFRGGEGGGEGESEAEGGTEEVGVVSINGVSVPPLGVTVPPLTLG